MKFAKMTLAVALIALIALLAAAQNAGAQAIKLAPANSLLVFRFANIEALSKKFADFCGGLGLTQMNPELADPLGSMMTKSGISAGLNKAGDIAAAMIDPGPNGSMDDSMIIFFPVTDYQAFIGNFPGATTDGDVTTMHFKDTPAKPGYMVHWGDYAAVSPDRNLVATKPTAFLTIGPMAQKELDAKDFVAYVNVAGVRARATPVLTNAHASAAQAIDRDAARHTKFGTLDSAKIAPVLKVAVDQVLNLAQEMVNDTDDATYSVNLSPDGIGSTFLAEMQPASKLGTLAAAAKNTDASLLSGLADNKYLAFGGSLSSPETTGKFVADFLDPISKSITDLGPTYSSFNDIIAAIKTVFASQTGTRFGMIAPSGPLGQDPLFQIAVIRTGDAKAILNATHSATDAWLAAMKELGIPQNGATTTITPAAKVLEGVTFDLYQTTFDMNAGGPQAAQAMQFIQFIYGPGGMQQYMGPVDDNTLLTVSGLSDQAISAAIGAVKLGDDPLAKGATVKSVAAQLPTQRCAAFYIPLDVWATTGLNYAKQFAMDMGVKIPEDLPPVGVTISTQGSSLRIDSYVPSQLITALTSAGMQMYMATHQGAPGGGGGGGGPGGPGGGL